MPPAKSCDCQLHIVCDSARYPRRGPPYVPQYVPPEDASFEEAQRMHRALRIERGVLVQSVVYGPDNRILVDALESQTGANYLGIAIVDDSVSDADLERMHAAGVRGARFNFWRTLKNSPTLDAFERTIGRIAELGWHARVHAVREDLLEVKEMLETVKIPVVIDHMCHPDTSLGTDQPVVRCILDLLRRDNFWIMVSCGERFSAMEQQWDDVVPLAKRFIEAAPARTVWCSDWPHLNFLKPVVPNDADLLELLYRFAPDAVTLQNILVDNPARLMGFTD